jgi:hypothetical protein
MKSDTSRAEKNDSETKDSEADDDESPRGDKGNDGDDMMPPLIPLVAGPACRTFEDAQNSVRALEFGDVNEFQAWR